MGLSWFLSWVCHGYKVLFSFLVFFSSPQAMAPFRFPEFGYLGQWDRFGCCFRGVAERFTYAGFESLLSPLEEEEK